MYYQNFHFINLKNHINFPVFSDIHKHTASPQITSLCSTFHYNVDEMA